MDNPLVTHAKHTIWCATNQDFQHHINLPRITPKGGVLGSYPVLWDKLAVPDNGNKRTYFHYYQIGNLPGRTFDIDAGENKWTNYLDLNISDNLLIDVFMVSGAIIPRDHIWVTQLYNGNIILAIQINHTMDYGTCNKQYFNGVSYRERFTLDNDNLIIRFYSNAYFEDIEYIKNAVSPKHPIRHVYKKITNQNDYSEFMRQVQLIENEFGESGEGVFFEDGFIRNRPLGYSDSYKGKYLGLMWDESFYKSLWYDLKYLPAFISNKHRGVRKYLIVTSSEYSHIDYHDDIDIYIVNKKTGKGVYYNRNTAFGISMITHNAYSINAGIVERYIELHDFLGSIDECQLRVMIRKGGRNAGMFNQKNRIEEMYRLDSEGILNALINTQSLVPEWSARSLEGSAYVQLMSARSQDVNTNMVVDAYGYNGIVSHFFDPLVPYVNQELVLPLPLLKPDNKTQTGIRTMFCYDKNGLFIDYFSNESLSHSVRLPSAIKGVTQAECFNMLPVTETGGGTWVNVDVEADEIEQYGFRCYVSSGDVSGISGDWDDVTDTDFYTYTPGTKDSVAKIEWNWRLLTETDMYPAVKSGKYMHVYKWNKRASDVYDGCIEIVCKGYQDWGGVITRRELSVPAGNVDVFANGLSLVEDIDYFMNWPTLVIVNKEINAAESINVVVRSYGFGDPRTNHPFKDKDVGFIKNGMLSINDVYDIRDSKSIRLVVENKLVDINEFNYGEYIKGDYYTDGKPYGISDYVLPIENFIPSADTWSLYKETLEIDARVSDYLTPRLPEIEALNPIVNITRWPVISPVVSSILYAFLRGYDFDNIVPDNYTSEHIEQWLKPYKWLLEYDPAYNKVDENYFRIEPHANSTIIIISQKQYEFLEWIIKTYLNNRVDLSVNVRIGD